MLKSLLQSCLFSTAYPKSHILLYKAILLSVGTIESIVISKKLIFDVYKGKNFFIQVENKYKNLPTVRNIKNINETLDFFVEELKNFL